MIQTHYKPRKTSLSLFSILLTLTAFAISANAIPPLATTMAKQFAISYETFGYIFMLQYICFTCASLLGGYIQHRFGLANRTLVVVGVLGVALLLMVGSLLPDFIWVVAWIIPLGFTGGLTETFSSIMVAEFEKGDSSRLLNLSQVFYCLGAIFAPQLVALLLDVNISWKVAFLIFGMFVFFIGGGFILFNRNTTIPMHSTSVSEPESPTQQVQIPLRQDTLFYLMATVLFLYVVIEISSASWISAYFEKSFHLSASSAARRLSLFWTGLIIGRTFMVIAPAKLTLWPGLLGGTFGMIIGNMLLSFGWSAQMATWAVLIYGIAAGPVWPVTVMISQRIRYSTRFTSGVIGIGALGAALGPLLGAQVIRYLGLAWFFPCLSIGSIVLFSLILITKHRILPQANQTPITGEKTAPDPTNN
jgi:fucose permease